MRAHVAAALLALAALTALAPSTSSAETPRERASQRFAEAERAGKDMRFGDALAAYRDAASLDPSAPFASVARARAHDLEAHAEGDFAPLARLERVRRDPRALADRDEIEALDRDRERFPRGRVRAEAAVLVAEAHRRMGTIDRAIALFEEVAADGAADRTTRALALSELVAMLQAKGDLDAAARALDRDPTLLPSLRADIHRLVRRVTLRRASFGVLAVIGAACAVALGAAIRRARDVRALPSRVLPQAAVAFSLYLGGAAALIAQRRDGDGRPFVWLGLAVLAAIGFARASRIAFGTRPLVRVAIAVASIACVLASAFLAVERTDASYLGSIGL